MCNNSFILLLNIFTPTFIYRHKAMVKQCILLILLFLFTMPRIAFTADDKNLFLFFLSFVFYISAKV
jgi:hypothetical protein